MADIALLSGVYTPPFTGSVQRTVGDKFGELLNAKDFLTNTAGTANQTTQLQALVTRAEQLGDLLWIPPDVTIRIDTSVTCGTGPLAIRLDGTILTPLDQTGFTNGMFHYKPATSSTQTVSANSIVEFPAGSNLFVTRLTVSSTTGYVAGCYVHIGCADLIHPSDSRLAFKRGEIQQVLSVNSGSGFIYLTSSLSETFTTSVTVRRLSDYKLSLYGNGKIRAISDVFAAGDGTVNTQHGALIIEGAVNADVQVNFENLMQPGVRMISCYGSDVKVRCTRFRNYEPSQQYLGYGAVAMAATRHCRFDVRADNVRHAFTTICYADGTKPLWDMGTPRECTITGIATNCSSAAWDTHGGCYDMRFQDIACYHKQRDSQSPPGVNYAFQDRGCNTVIDGFSVVGAQLMGFFLAGCEHQYGRHNTPVYSNIFMNNTDIARSPTIWNTVAEVTESNVNKRLTFQNLNTLYYSQNGHADGGPPISINGWRCRYSRNMNMGVATSGSTTVSDVTISDLYWETDSSSIAITVYPGQILRIFNCQHRGAIASGLLVRVFGSVSSADYIYRNFDDFTGSVPHYGAQGGGATLNVTNTAAPTSTTAALAAIGNAINTVGKFPGKTVFNTSTSILVVAVGATTGAVWANAGTGVTAHTPA